MEIRRTAIALGAAVAMVAGCSAVNGNSQDVTAQSRAERKPPFGGPANVAYAQELWSALAAERMVGPNTETTHPYKGQPPHGGVLELLEAEITVDGTQGLALVKKNYRAEDMSAEALIDAVLEDQKAQLASVTVMFQRESGYDPDHDDWYWAKYAPDGSLLTNPKGMKLGGRVAKGAPKGCIACHEAAPGDDYIFTHDKYAAK